MKNLINEIANPIRIDILNYLSENPSSFTDLANKINISKSEISRHLSRLVEKDFVKKEGLSKKFELTSLGKTIVILFSPVMFVLKYSNYFKNHDLIDLPFALIKEIDMLNDSQLIQGVGNVMFKLTEMIDRAKDKLFVLTDQRFPMGKPGLDVYYIVPPKLIDNTGEKAADQNRSSHVVILSQVPISILMVDEGEGMVFFPDSRGQLDFTNGFYVESSNKNGITYLQRVWSFFWDKGKPLE